MKRITSRLLTALMLAALMVFSSVPALAASSSSSTITLVERSATAEPLRLGSRGSEVKAVQKRLKERATSMIQPTAFSARRRKLPSRLFSSATASQPMAW